MSGSSPAPWLAGRVGDGYVAVAADGGFGPQRTGDEASRLWPVGDGREYVTTVGRAAATARSASSWRR